MSKQDQKAAPKSAESSENKGGAPTHGLFHIEDPRKEGVKGKWTEIAVGWQNADGSINVRARAGAILQIGQSYQLRVLDKKED